MEPTLRRPGTPKKAVNQQFKFGPWTMSTCKSHILESQGPLKDRFDSECELPQLPEMVFGENCLRVMHESGCGMEFSTLDALKLVNPHTEPANVKVAAAKEWQGSRSDCEDINNVVSPFDWTYTTDYKGTVIDGNPAALMIKPSTDRIDIEKLKTREPIHFYDDVLLFEDELSDHGTAMLSVKVRVMPSCFFILMRFFVRVDQVLIRVNDTRLFHEAGTNFIIREYSSKEEKTENIPTAMHTNPNEVSQFLKLVTESVDRIEIPQT